MDTDRNKIFGGKDIHSVVDGILSNPNIPQETVRVLDEIKGLEPLIRTVTIQSLWRNLYGRKTDISMDMARRKYGDGVDRWFPLNGRHGLSEDQSIALNLETQEATGGIQKALSAIREYILEPGAYGSLM